MCSPKSKNPAERSPLHIFRVSLKARPYLGSMQVMVVGVSSADEQLAWEIEMLTKTIEEKDMQIASLMSKLEERHGR